jgi:antirestriction protein
MEKTDSERLKEAIDLLLAEDTSNVSPQAFLDYCDNHHITYEHDLKEALSDCQDAYLGQYDRVLDYAIEYVDETGMLNDVPSTIANYFDYEAYAKDLVLSGDVWLSDNGHLFRSI